MKCKSNTAKIIETLTKIDLWISISTSVGAKAKGGASRVAQQPMQWNKTDLDMIVNSRGPRSCKRYDGRSCQRDSNQCCRDLFS